MGIYAQYEQHNKPSDKCNNEANSFDLGSDYEKSLNFDRSLTFHISIINMIA